MIRWRNPNRIRHFELIEHIRDEYYEETLYIVDKIRDNLSEIKIGQIIYSYDDSIIKPKVKELVSTFLIERRKRLLKIYYAEKEAE